LDQQEPLRELFNRYLNNQCSPEEVNRLLQYFNIRGNEESLRLLVEEALDQPVNSATAQAFQPSLDQAYAHITQQMHHAAPVIPWYRRRFMQVAAAAALIIVAATWYLMRQGANTDSKAPVYRQLATAKGQRLQHRLSDGTTIWLAPGSTLQYPDRFSGPQREVTLQGEAFFDVARDAVHPFIVHAANMQTFVLGTSFTVQAYDNDPAVEVTLVTGKVQVSMALEGRIEQIHLVPDQRAIYNKASRQLTKEAYPDAAQMIARRDGLLVYKGSPLSKVIRDLEFNYNVSIDLPAVMQTCTYYGRLNTKQAIAQVLQQIALTYNASFRHTNNRWEILNGTCHN
jgi:transmembrane sensor